MGDARHLEGWRLLLQGRKRAERAASQQNLKKQCFFGFSLGLHVLWPMAEGSFSRLSP